MLLAGDISYYGSIEDRYQEVFAEPYRPLIDAGVEWELAIGNHEISESKSDDAVAAIQAQVRAFFEAERPDGPLAVTHLRGTKNIPCRYDQVIGHLRKYNLLPAIFFLKSRAECDRAIVTSDPGRRRPGTTGRPGSGDTAEAGDR